MDWCRMVLICNNNVLSIDKFHENRTREKNEIKNIIINFASIREKYMETPYVPPPEPDLSSFLRDFESMEPPKKNVITFSRRQ